ncbi:hypothetical protein ACIUYQ_09395 [Pseudomonas aeruginosa]
MNKANECTCPSGDGSLRHPCPAHPASVEQAGGDERAAFFKHLIGRHPAHETEIVRVVEHNHAAWKAWQARAALAQPSPASDLDPLNLAPHAEAFNEAPAEALKPEPAEADRPEVVAWQYRVTAGPQTGWSLWHPGKGEEFERSYTVERRPLMTVAQHERIVKAWIERWKAYIELSAKIAAQRDAADARLHEVATACATAEQERDAALARVAELEKQERPEGWVQSLPLKDHQPCKPNEDRANGYTIPIYSRPVLVEEALRKLRAVLCDPIGNVVIDGSDGDREEVQRALGMLAAAPGKAQHSAPEVSGIGRDTGHPRAVVLYLRKEPTDDDLRAIHDALRSLAAAPGKEVPQAWLDVQAERRRQITAEGWTPEHDDLYCAAELPRAAAAYILNGANDEAPAIWPFSAKWWKPRDARANYVRAAALILAEIERLDRAAPGKEGV